MGRHDDGEAVVPLLVPALGGGGEEVARELGLSARVAGDVREDARAAAIVVGGHGAEQVTGWLTLP